MKTPSISLAAIARIDAGPLLKALDIYKKAAGEIVSARFRLERLKKEIDEFLEKTDPDDEKAISALAGKRIQMEIIPGLIAKIEQTIDDKLIPSIEKAFDEFKVNLNQFYSDAYESYAAQLAEIIRQFFPDTFEANGQRMNNALRIAYQSDDCRKIAFRMQTVESIVRKFSRVGVSEIEQDGRNLCEASEQLVALAKQD